MYYIIIAGTAIYGNPLDILETLYFAYLAAVFALILSSGITVIKSTAQPLLIITSVAQEQTSGSPCQAVSVCSWGSSNIAPLTSICLSQTRIFQTLIILYILINSCVQRIA